MATNIDQFVPEVWAAEILVALRENLVYGQPGVINRDYEGEIAQAGDTVHITSFGDPSVASYVAHDTLTYEQLDDATRALIVNQADKFSFKVDDIERRQALNGFVEQAGSRAGYKLAEAADGYISDVMYAAVNATANDIGAFTADISDNTAYGLFVQLRTKLNRSKVPATGRFAIVPPELTAALLQDNRFLNASASGSTDALRNGEVGRIAGFTVYESNMTPDPTASTFAVIAGHPMATTYAEQINSVEAIRLQTSFGDGIRGLHLYGAKVTRPEALAMASVVVVA